MRKNPGFKIILGLLLPPTILHLEFKSKEELELMPQTEEEFLVQEEQEEEDTTSESSIQPGDLESVGKNSYLKISQVRNVSKERQGVYFLSGISEHLQRRSGEKQ